MSKKKATKSVHKKFQQAVSTKSVDKKCPQNVSTNRVNTKFPQNVSTKCVPKKCPPKGSPKSFLKSGGGGSCPLRGLGTDYVISGPISGLKNCI